jgi:hypothetical protein
MLVSLTTRLTWQFLGVIFGMVAIANVEDCIQLFQSKILATKSAAQSDVKGLLSVMNAYFSLRQLSDDGQ